MSESKHKGRALYAIHEMLDAYEDVLMSDNTDELYEIGNVDNCLLCRTFYKAKGCYGCPSAGNAGEIGCTESPTYMAMIGAIEEFDPIKDAFGKVHEAIKARVAFWTTRIEILRAMPSEWYDPDRKSDFDIENMLDVSWLPVIGEHHPGKIIFICSPLSGDIQDNIVFAESKARQIALGGDIPICPHQIARYLDDREEHERDRGMKVGHQLLSLCQQMNVYGKDITAGMAEEIAYCIGHRIPIAYIDA